VHSGTGYISQDDIRLHFGLGKAVEVEQLDVRWPNGEVESLRGIAANRLITIRRGEGIVAEGFNAVIRGAR
jgi:enediyne biosynthesis protein E4